MQPWQVCNPYTLVLLKLCNEFTDYGFLDFFSKMAAGKWWLFSNLPTLDFVIGFLCVFMLFVQLSLSVASSLTCIWLERLCQMFTTLWTMCQKKHRILRHLQYFIIWQHTFLKRLLQSLLKDRQLWRQNCAIYVRKSWTCNIFFDEIAHLFWKKYQCFY